MVDPVLHEITIRYRKHLSFCKEIEGIPARMGEMHTSPSSTWSMSVLRPTFEYCRINHKHRPSIMARACRGHCGPSHVVDANGLRRKTG